MASSNSSSGGIGVGFVLFCVFLALKLTNVINWSWWWVTAPLWGRLIIAALIFIVIVFIAALAQKR